MTILRVQYQGDVVGRAIPDEHRDEFAFQYEVTWLDRADAFPISANLPLRSSAWPSARAHAFFANLLPEGSAREAICDRLGVSPGNDVALLSALGGDTAGALRFVPDEAQSDADRARRPITDSELAEWASGEPAFPQDLQRAPRLSLAGAQHKATVVRTDDGYALPGSDEASTHILKFDSPRFPHLAANEFLTTRFAAELGLDVVHSRLDSRTDPPMLVVERYDRGTASQEVSRIHQEDFCQVLGVLPSRKYESDGGPTLAEVAGQIRRLSAQPARDVLELLRWVLFCAVAGNADGHAKNLSLVYDVGRPHLAPFYDLVCTRAYPRLDSRMAFSVGGTRDSDRILQENWKAFAEEISVRPRLVMRELRRILETAEDCFERACDTLHDQIGQSHAVQHVGQVVRKRIRAIPTHL
ncbi:MAG: type II toxin-antitoxin system HipA family toxin [Myxococcota bacterium]